MPRAEKGADGEGPTLSPTWCHQDAPRGRRPRGVSRAPLQSSWGDARVAVPLAPAGVSVPAVQSPVMMSGFRSRVASITSKGAVFSFSASGFYCK